MPDLITNSRAIQNATLSALNSTNPTYLASLITAASDAIRSACHRDFVQASYTEYYSGSGNPGAAEPLRLRQYPVLEITRVASSPRPALLVVNSDSATNQRATVETTPTAVQLVRIASAVPTTVMLNYADYPTVGQLAIAINALGHGWSASVQTQTITGDFSKWPTSDLRPLQGAVTAFLGGAALEIFAEDVEPFLLGTNFPAGVLDDLGPGFGWRLDDETGEVYARFPRGHLNIRIDYTAGYATVPQAIQEACVQLAQDLYQAGLVNSTLRKATLGGSSIEVQSQSITASLSGKVKLLIAPYVDYSKVMFR